MIHILLIEDNEDIIDMTADILELEGYKVSKAFDGKEGFEMATELIPDLIICDVMMPKMDGYEVFEKLNQNAKTAVIPFIFLTAKSEKSDVRKGMNVGADDYLIKPFEAKELIEAIEARSKKSEFLKQTFSNSISGIDSFMQKASELLQIEDLSKNKEIIIYKNKDKVFEKGKQAHFLYFIESGNVKLHQMTESGKEFVFGIFGKGDFLGQLSLLGDKNSYIYTATVMGAATICKIPKEDFTKLLFDNKEISQKFIELISNNIVQLQEQLKDMAFSSVHKRAAKALLQLFERGIISNQNNVSLNIPREDFAGLIGTASETAIRTLHDFRNQGIIEIESSKTILLLNEKKLRDIVK